MKRILSIVISVTVLLTAMFTGTGVMLSTFAEEPLVYTGNVENGSFEDGQWNIVKNATNKIVKTGLFGGRAGEKSQGIWRTKETTNPLLMTGTAKAEALASLDKTVNQSLMFYVKTQDAGLADVDNFEGIITVTLTQGGQKLTMGGSTKFYALGDALSDGSMKYSNWCKIITPGFVLGDGDIKIEIEVNGTGVVYFDDFEFLPDPENDNLIKKGSFEEGTWYQEPANGSTQTLVTDVTHNSSKAVRLTGIEEKGQINIGSDMKPEFDRTKKYTLSLSLKTEGCKEGAVEVRILEMGKKDGVATSNWLKVYGNEGFIKPEGTSDWQTYTVNLNRFTDYEGYACRFYVMFKGIGNVWVDNVYLKEKEVNTNVQAGVVSADTEVGEVSPMTSVRLMTATDPADIYFTVDGSDPKTSPNTMLYSDEEGIIITEDTVVKAYVASEDGDGDVAEFEYTCTSILPDPDFETDTWNTAIMGAAELDTTERASGESSMKLTGNGMNLSASTGMIAFDSLYDYTLSFRVKTEEMLMDNSTYVSIFMRDDTGGVTHLNVDGQSVRGSFYINQFGLFDIKKSQDWTYYEIDLNDLNGAASALNIYAGINNDMGTAWFDDFKLVAKQNAVYPLSMTSAAQSDQMLGSVYTQNIMEDFTVMKNVTVKNSSNLEETGTLSYQIRKANGDILGTGEIEGAGVAPLGRSSYEINLSPIAEYGIFYVDFKMENKRGYIYDVGTVNISRVRDASANDSSKLAMSQHAMTGGYLNNKFDKESIDKYFDLLAAAGVKYIREDCLWGNIETSENVYEFPEYWDTYLDSAAEHGIKVLLVVNGSSSSYHGSTDFPRTESEITAFCNYAKAVATKYNGKVAAFELLNETNFSGVCTGAEYANLLKHFYQTIKSVNPENKVVGGVLSQADTVYTEDILKAGGADYMDVYSFHPYVYPESPETAKYLDRLESMKATFAKYTEKYIPFWITEVGWSTCLNEKGVTEEQQANYQVRLTALLESVDYVEYMFHYETHSGSQPFRLENNWGMTQAPGNEVNSYSARQNYVAYAAHISLLNGYKFKEELKLANGLYTYKFSNSAEGKDIYMLWTNDMETPATIKLSKASARYFDIYGNALSITYNSDNLSFTESLGGRPAYLMLDDDISIESIVLAANNAPEEETVTTPSDSTVTAPSEDNTTEEEPEKEENKKKTYKVKRIKRTKGKKADDFALSPLVIALISGGAVILAAGVTLLIIFLKRRKRSK